MKTIPGTPRSARFVGARRSRSGRHRPSRRRRGAAALDFALLLGATLSLAGVTLYQSGRVIRAVYAFTCTLISWPFL